jgi:hypothetical protein
LNNVHGNLVRDYFFPPIFGKYFFKKEQELDSTNFANLWISKRIAILLNLTNLKSQKPLAMIKQIRNIRVGKKEEMGV